MKSDKQYAESIAKQYAPKETTKVDALRELDREAKSGARIFAYTFGVLMVLLLGIGMCLSMDVIGDGSQVSFVLGIIVGVIGIAGVSVNYPLYRKLLEKGKQKYASEILELADQISEQGD